jgi:broad specificity phosphatase PhoE
VTGTSVRVLLIRHAETDSNLEGRWQGQSDSSLTERGFAQAKALGAALSTENIAAIYSSDLRRAMLTAQEVAGPHGLSVVEAPELREIHVGNWEGKLRADLAASHPEMMDAWQNRPWEVHFEGGESLALSQARALKFLDRVLPQHLGEQVVVMTHGTMAQAILAATHADGLRGLWIGLTQNCQIARLDWADGKLTLVDACDIRHLDKVGGVEGWRVFDQSSASMKG